MAATKGSGKRRLKSLNKTAAEATALNVEFIRDRLQRNREDALQYYDLREALDAETDPDRKKLLKEQMDRCKPMDDRSAATYLRVLSGLSDSTAKQLEDETDGLLQVHLTVD